MNENSDGIKWLKGKAERDERIAKKDREAKQKKALLLASELYEKWKKVLLKRKQTTADDLVTQLENLYEQIDAAFATAKLEDWKPMVLDMIREKTARIIAGQIAEVNQVKELLPSTAKGIVPHEARIRSKDEFLALPFIKRISEKDGFVGFLRDFPRVWAVFADGEFIDVCSISSEVGLTEFPTLAQYSTTFAKDQRKN